MRALFLNAYYGLHICLVQITDAVQRNYIPLEIVHTLRSISPIGQIAQHVVRNHMRMSMLAERSASAKHRTFTHVLWPEHYNVYAACVWLCVCVWSCAVAGV